jgi:hypothetical protein
MPETDPLEALEDGPELTLAKKKNEAFELELRLMCKKTLLVLLTFAACWACLEWCKPCLIGVVAFSACMCGEARLLVIPLVVSLIMLLVAYMSTLKRVLVFGEEIGKLQEMGSKID